jgi:hypothetical protein
MAEELRLKNGGGLSSRARALVLLAWVLWRSPKDPTKLKASEIVGILDPPGLALVGSLYSALSQGPDGIDRWHDAHRKSAPRGSSGDGGRSPSNKRGV